METVDILILGAGAAGLFCGIEAARRGRRVLVIDHAARAGEKIRISGGGRCNVTNLAAGAATAPERFLSENPRFALSALRRFTPADLLARLEAGGIGWVEKAAGQLFLDGKAERLVALFTRQLAEAGGMLWLGCAPGALDRRPGGGFVLDTGRGPIRADRVVVATGGRSIPKIGASGLGYRLAEQFGIRVTETRPGLVPLTFADQELARLAPLAGVGVPARVSLDGNAAPAARRGFEDGFLFTHRGLSGPSILQISSYWREGDSLSVDLAPGRDLGAELRAARGAGGRVTLGTALARLLPERVAGLMLDLAGLDPGLRLADQGNLVLDRLAAGIARWQLRPVGSEGYRTAEVTLGGVDTAALDARSLEAKSVPGLHFIGEVVDLTGWLGGYNFQWAWASAWAAAQAM